MRRALPSGLHPARGIGSRRIARIDRSDGRKICRAERHRGPGGKILGRSRGLPLGKQLSQRRRTVDGDRLLAEIAEEGHDREHRGKDVCRTA
jgi:hypothetical protein